jgi:uncharacterized membrane protein HdeD (DUF308 family)
VTVTWSGADRIRERRRAANRRFAAIRGLSRRVLDGVVSLGVAAFIVFARGLSAIALVSCVGAGALMVGAVRLVLVIAPGSGLLAVIWIIGLEAIAMGALFVGFGLRLRGMKYDPHAAAGA